MPRPTSDSDAVGAMSRGSQRPASSRSSSWIAAGSTALAPGSRDTVTLVSEVDTESIDNPWRAKHAKTSARKPTCRHMLTVSIETRVMPRRDDTALTSGPLAGPTLEITVPAASGRSVHRTCSGMPCRRSGGIDRGWRTCAPVVASSWASS